MRAARAQGGFWYANAVKESELPAPARLVALVLASVADSSTGRVKLSLSAIAHASGLGRRTVARHLAILEAAGFVRRNPPPAWKAVKEHEATEYTTVIPAGYPVKAVPRVVEKAGDNSDSPSGPSARAALALVPETTKASARAAHSTTSTNASGARSAGATRAADAENYPPPVQQAARNLGTDCDCPQPKPTIERDQCAACYGNLKDAG